MTFLNESFGEWKNIEKPTVIPVSYEGLDDKEKVKIVLAHDKDHHVYYYVVSNLKSDDEIEENIFEEQIED